jgi:hypothetical protein
MDSVSSSIESTFSFIAKDNINVIDKHESLGLKLHHYDQNEVKKSSPKDSLRKVRGLVTNSSGVVVATSFGYTPTIVLDKLTDNYDFVDIDGKNQNINPSSVKAIYPMLDGTLIRVWKHQSKIFVSTHKKIDASKSHWGSSENFTNLFLKYTENYFNLEDLFPETIEEKYGVEMPPVIHNFLLVDMDTLVCSKINLGEKDGFVAYINTFNGGLYLKEAPENISVYDIKNTEKTFFSIKSLDTLEEQNEFLSHGFSSMETNLNPLFQRGEGLVFLYKEKFDDYKLLKIVHPSYQRRSELVGNDPNILHRTWSILSQSLFPRKKDEVDTYLEKFPPVPCPSVLQFSNIEDTDYSIPTEEALTKKNNLETKDLRFRNALIHYAMSLPIYHFVPALNCYNEVVKAKGKIINILRNDFEKYISGSWGKPSDRDLKVYERIQEICKEAKKFANTRYSNGERLDGKNEFQTIRQFTKDNLKGLINNEYGENMYKIVRVLITNAEKEDSEIKVT